MGESTSTKWCPGCAQRLPVADFGVNRAKPDGLQLHCRSCRADIQRRYRAKHPEKMRELGRNQMRRRREADPERVKAYQQQWVAENAEKNRQARRAWEAANYERHRANARLASQRWKVANPVAVKAEDLRRRAVKVAASVDVVDLKTLWVRQCGICSLCGHRIVWDLPWPDPMSKSVDHIIPLARGGAHSQKNLQWVHLVENLRKGARLS